MRTASTLRDARRLLSERAAEIVVSDQIMPKITGSEFLAEVAVTYPLSYRVLLTGSAPVGLVLSEVSAGLIHHFIPKPWTERDIEQMLERAALYFERSYEGEM